MAENFQVQFQAHPDLDRDLSQIVAQEGEQLMTVGSHRELARPLNDDERTRVERTGVCMGCHQNMASPEFWKDGVVVKYGQVASTDEHIDAMNQVILDAIAADGKVQIPERPSNEDLAEAVRAAANAKATAREGEQALAAAQDEIAAAQADTEAVEAGLDATKAEVAWVRGELDVARGEIDAVRTERDDAREKAIEDKTEVLAAQATAMVTSAVAETPTGPSPITAVALIESLVAVVLAIAVVIAAGLLKLAPDI